MSDRDPPDYDEAADVDVEAVADRLPSRPLDHSEARDLD
jgi:hypothetical protein